jgi:hypothetical protein
MAVAGGLSVALGAWADLGALLILAFLLPVAFFMHAFWKETDEQAKANQMAHFMKNMAMAGAALVILYAYNQLQGDAGLSITNPLFGRGQDPWPEPRATRQAYEPGRPLYLCIGDAVEAARVVFGDALRWEAAIESVPISLALVGILRFARRRG